MAPIFIDKSGTNRGTSENEMIVALAQTAARISTAAASDVTDSSTGSARANRSVLAAATAVNEAASGSNLAQKAATETALATVTGALATLFTAANALATRLGLPTVTYDGGGTDGAGTVAAMTQTTTGATTGAQAAQWNAVVNGVNAGFYSLAHLVNKLATATGENTLTVGFDGSFGTVAAIPTTVGTAAAPGVTKAAVDAALVVFADNAATIAARLNAMTGAFVTPKIVVG